jgi:hypothetical protein
MSITIVAFKSVRRILHTTPTTKPTLVFSIVLPHTGPLKTMSTALQIVHLILTIKSMAAKGHALQSATPITMPMPVATAWLLPPAPALQWPTSETTAQESVCRVTVS